MAIDYKVLGQVCPSTINTLTALYTVPAGTSAIVSSIVVNDSGANGGAFAIAVAVGGAADDQKQYLYGSPTNGIYMQGGDVFIATVGLTLAAGDVVNVRNISAHTSEMTFQLFGNEIT
jgi:hypothetical protein